MLCILSSEYFFLGNYSHFGSSHGLWPQVS